MKRSNFNNKIIIIINNMNNYDLIKMNISSGKIKNCKQVALLLKECGIISNIKSNYSIVKNNNNYIIENGCNISIFKSSVYDIPKIWNILQYNYNLSCMYLEVKNFKGCIFNFLRKTKCPE